MYYTYSRHKSLHAAQDALEEYFATEAVCEGERPRIIREGDLYSVQFFDWSYCY